jgi:hypothetical protein
MGNRALSVDYLTQLKTAICKVRLKHLTAGRVSYQFRLHRLASNPVNSQQSRMDGGTEIEKIHLR